MFLRDSVRFVVKAQTPKGDKNVTITLDNNLQDDQLMPRIPMPESANSKQLLTYLAADKELFNTETQYGIGDHIIALKEVNIKSIKVKPVVLNSYNNTGHADQIVGYDYFSKATCTTAVQCLQGILKGVLFDPNGNPYLPRNSARNLMRVMINGVDQKLTEKSKSLNYVYDSPEGILNTLSAAEIESVEVIKNPMEGTQGAYGTIYVNLKSADAAKYDNDHDTYKPGIINLSPKGYYAVRTFYSPQYDSPKTNTKLADLRSTIYWKPNIVTDQNGHASLEYFNAGKPGTYRVTVEGIDAAGNLGRKVYKYKVGQ
jgi:hypothetical protein